MVKKLTIEVLKSQPEGDLVINQIVNRKRQGLYSLILTAGLPGSGKSSACQRLAQLTSEKLNEGECKFTHKHICSSLLEFIEVVMKATPESNTICVIEEVSVLFPSRRAMATENVDLAKVLDTCRKKEIIIFANAPLWPTIDSHMRAMGNIYLETIRVFKNAGLVFLKCYKLQTNPGSGKTYKHNFKRGTSDVNRMYTLQPDKVIWADYEGQKDDFMKKIYEQVKARAMDKEAKTDKLIQKHTESKYKPLTNRELKIYDLVWAKNLTHEQASKEIGVSRRRISQICKEITQKLEDSLGN